MDLQLFGKHAVITGGSKGIGLAAASSLLGEGCSVTLVARGAAALEAARKHLLGEGHKGVQILVADLAGAEGAETVGSLEGPIDILVNNAGAIPHGDLKSIDDATWRAAWDLKVFGTIDLCRRLYERLAARRGVIVNIIGAGGETLPPDYIAGAAGNAALMGFTRAVARGASRDGLRIVGINPGAVATDRIAQLLRAKADAEFGDAERWQDYVVGMPFRRFATPQEIGDAVAFLASPRSSYTTGTILSVSGGL